MCGERKTYLNFKQLSSSFGLPACIRVLLKIIYLLWWSSFVRIVFNNMDYGSRYAQQCDDIHNTVLHTCVCRGARVREKRKIITTKKIFMHLTRVYNIIYLIRVTSFSPAASLYLIPFPFLPMSAAVAATICTYCIIVHASYKHS